MDLKMDVEEIKSTGVTWDVAVENGLVPILTDDEENMQGAVLAGFLERGTIPQLPDAGVPWQDFLTKKISFGELDSEVRDSLRLADKSEYYPDYELVDDKITLTIGREA